MPPPTTWAASANQGQLDRSRELFNAILAREPDNAAALTALAQIDWARDGAKRLSSAATRPRGRPADGGSRFVLTQFLVTTGRAAEAVEVAREAVAIAPGSAPFANALGVALLESGNRPRRCRSSRARWSSIRRSALPAQQRAGPTGARRGRAAREHWSTHWRSNRTMSCSRLLVDLERRAGRSTPRARRWRGSSGQRRKGIRASPCCVASSCSRSSDSRGRQCICRSAARLGAGARAAIGLFETRRRGNLPDPAAPLQRLAARTSRGPGGAQPAGRAFPGRRRPAGRDPRVREADELAPDHPLFLNNLAWLYGELATTARLPLARRAHELRRTTR
jgi:cellulose synthase operon protein C